MRHLIEADSFLFVLGYSIRVGNGGRRVTATSAGVFLPFRARSRLVAGTPGRRFGAELGYAAEERRFRRRDVAFTVLVCAVAVCTASNTPSVGTRPGGVWNVAILFRHRCEEVSACARTAFVYTSSGAVPLQYVPPAAHYSLSVPDSVSDLLRRM